jgi:hypothetical protein
LGVEFYFYHFIRLMTYAELHGGSFSLYKIGIVIIAQSCGDSGTNEPIYTEL